MRINYHLLRSAPYVSPFYERRGLLQRGLRWASRRLMRTAGADEADAILTERMAELPEFIRRIDRLRPATPILDVGCAESLMPLHYLAMGYEVHGMDLRDPGLNLRGFTYIPGDAGRVALAERYDAITLLSTLEHCGFGHYGGVDLCDDGQVVRNLRGALTERGRFIVSVPSGRAKELGWFRVYDLPRLEALFGEIVEPRWFIYEEPSWYPCSHEDVRDIETTQWSLAVVVFESPA